MVRRTSTVNFERIAHIQDQLTLVPGGLLDEGPMIPMPRHHRPRQVYNLAAPSFVPSSWTQPVFTGETPAPGVPRILDAVRSGGSAIRFYQAGTSQRLARRRQQPQAQDTPFY